MNDIVEGTILVMAVMSIILIGLVLYLICLVMGLEIMVSRLGRPEVPRDWNGRKTKERL